MVKKLIKHEFIYYIRNFGMFLPIVLAIGTMTRVFLFFDGGNVINELAIFSSVMMLIIASCALIVMSTVVSIVRFYKNMYSSEGYLSFTLPVTNAQHICVKLLAAMVCQFVSILTVTAAAAISLSGERLDTFLRDVGSAFSLVVEPLAVEYGVVNIVIFIIEIVLALIVSSASSFLLYYACITVGQTAKKNRVLMAVGAYFIYYMASQVISTVISMVVMILGMSGAFEGIVVWSSYHPMATAHIYLGTILLFSAALAVAFYLVTHRIMTKKLNLE